MAAYHSIRNGRQVLILPAQHPATLARRGKAPVVEDPEHTIQQVYAPGFAAVVNVPLTAVRHMPPASINVTRLMLCSKYDPAKGKASCPMGSRCKFVHADDRGAERHEMHVNYAWRRLEDVTYERYPAGEMLTVAQPDGAVAVDVMDSHMVLKTQALASKRRPLSHCAHYYFNRSCNLGADCQFVHAVYIDPEARDFQRAPPPSHLGRHRDDVAPSAPTVRASRSASLHTGDCSAATPVQRGVIARRAPRFAGSHVGLSQPAPPVPRPRDQHEMRCYSSSVAQKMDRCDVAWNTSSRHISRGVAPSSAPRSTHVISLPGQPQCPPFDPACQAAEDASDSRSDDCDGRKICVALPTGERSNTSSASGTPVTQPTPCRRFRHDPYAAVPLPTPILLPRRSGC